MKTEVHFFPPLNPGAIWFRPFLNGSSGMWKGLAAALIRALARVHRWNRMLGDGKCRSASEIAEAENVTRSFVNRLLRLTLLAPDIVKAILDGRQPKAMQLEELTDAISNEWEKRGRSGGRLFCQAPPKRVGAGRLSVRYPGWPLGSRCR